LPIAEILNVAEIKSRATRTYYLAFALEMGEMGGEGEMGEMGEMGDVGDVGDVGG